MPERKKIVFISAKEIMSIVSDCLEKSKNIWFCFPFHIMEFKWCLSDMNTLCFHNSCESS